MIFELTDLNFEMYAIKNYDNPACKGMSEFLDDLNRFKYIKRLLRKHSAGKELRERLILNHIVILYNLFGSEAATKMLFFKIEKEYWPHLKTFLIFLNYMPEKIVISKDLSIIDSDISVDVEIVELLRTL
jgi:hypothetical protein